MVPFLIHTNHDSLEIEMSHLIIQDKYISLTSNHDVTFACVLLVLGNSELIGVGNLCFIKWCQILYLGCLCWQFNETLCE